MVMSPLSSTSWQTTALEWIVNLSRLRREQVSERERMVAGWIHIGGMSVGGEFEFELGSKTRITTCSASSGRAETGYDLLSDAGEKAEAAGSLVEGERQAQASAGKRGLCLPALRLRCLRLPVSSPDTHPVFTGPGRAPARQLLSPTLPFLSLSPLISRALVVHNPHHPGISQQPRPERGQRAPVGPRCEKRPEGKSGFD